jgi:8-oxo-dGTP pyrophosphatase MutT (NUDIX family)
MSAGARSFEVVRSPVRTRQPSGEFIQLSQLRKLRECEQVAAVCYRVRNGGIEFLLVQTRDRGRWTFPKGSAEPGLSHAQAAALEAFEEAGVHGRIEVASFTRYVRRKRGGATGSGERDLAVKAHLCEVSRLSPPQESKRNRTWFSVQDARRRLREGRKSGDGATFARVVDRAVARIQRSQVGTGMVNDRRDDDRLHDHWPRRDAEQKDPLRRVRFEVFEGAYGRMEEGWFTPYARRQVGDVRRSSVVVVDVQPSEVLQGETLRFGSPREKKLKALGTGSKNG